jgi:ABC-2 type transport system ATP-binding protein
VAELARTGKAIFYCSHVLEVVEKLCSHVIVLRKGNVIAYGSIDDLKRQRSMQTLEQTFSQLVEENDAADVARKLASLTLEAAA